MLASKSDSGSRGRMWKLQPIAQALRRESGDELKAVVIRGRSGQVKKRLARRK
jgi:hypothetical protein